MIDLEGYNQYFIYPTELDTLYKGNAIVVPDANFLLLAYQWREVTTDKVKKVLKELSEKERLKIPEQVLYEFSKNRQKVLFEQLTSVNDEMKRFNDPKPKIRDFMPAAEESSEINDAQKKRENLSQAITEYKKSLKKVKEKIENLIKKDEYFDFIKSLCQNSFLPYSTDKESLRKEGVRRISLGIKPGTNENKGDPTGDYIIWHEIIQLQEHIIFVSNDQKKDWIYKNNNGQELGMDQLLLAEFHSETGGKSFLHITPKKFIKYIDPHLDRVIEEDLSKSDELAKASYAISSNSIKFGDDMGEVDMYWEFRLNRIPELTDCIKVSQIFTSLGSKNTPAMVMYDESEQKHSIIVNCSIGIPPKGPARETYQKVSEHFGSELIRARFHPVCDQYYGFIPE
ncbi:PIN-like domain-containing protein [Bacillus toyonensis]|uniref:PIN-like domain-containing protein n=1 Tax=Bacillus toyonensis TaxID=155322 RepID=UPI00211D9497|nr:PIN domain-containing protein [Bacillus toyonensis]